MSSPSRRWCIGVVVLAVAACTSGPAGRHPPVTESPRTASPSDVGATPTPSGTPAPGPTARSPSRPAASAAYRVDAARSEVRILTFRAGPLARLGHGHVLISRDLRGSVTLREDGGAAAFDLRLPVASLAIDEPEARAEEGPEFASVPTPEDVAGTRRNLLGPQVLDATAHPELRVTGAAAPGEDGERVVQATVQLRGRALPLDVPVRVARRHAELVATGEFRVTQTALGLTPFSVAFGALQVRDELVVRFRVTAVPPT